MNNLYFIFFLILGYLIQQKTSLRLLAPLKTVCTVNLYLLVFVEFLRGVTGLAPGLVLAGLFLPVASAWAGLSFFRQHTAWREIALSYSTFGGGNRGLMAILMFAPDYLRAFIAFDLGIFLALGFLPFLESRVTRSPSRKQLSSFQSILFIALAAGLGILLGQIEQLAASAPQLRSLLGGVALVSIPLYLGCGLKLAAAFNLRQFIVLPVVFRAVFFLPLGLALAYAVTPGPIQHQLVYLVGLYTLLPASSMAPQFIQDPKLAEKLNQHVAFSSLLFIVGISITALLISPL